MRGGVADPEGASELPTHEVWLYRVGLPSVIHNNVGVAPHSISKVVCGRV